MRLVFYPHLVKFTSTSMKNNLLFIKKFCLAPEDIAQYLNVDIEKVKTDIEQRYLRKVQLTYTPFIGDTFVMKDVFLERYLEQLGNTDSLQPIGYPSANRRSSHLFNSYRFIQRKLYNKDTIVILLAPNGTTTKFVHKRSDIALKQAMDYANFMDMFGVGNQYSVTINFSLNELQTMLKFLPSDGYNLLKSKLEFCMYVLQSRRMK